MPSPHCITLYGSSTAEIMKRKAYLTEQFAGVLGNTNNSVQPTTSERMQQYGYTHELTLEFRDGTTFTQAQGLSATMSLALSKEKMDVSRSMDNDKAEGWRGKFAERFMIG